MIEMIEKFPDKPSIVYVYRHTHSALEIYLFIKWYNLRIHYFRLNSKVDLCVPFISNAILADINIRILVILTPEIEDTRRIGKVNKAFYFLIVRLERKENIKKTYFCTVIFEYLAGVFVCI